MISFDDFEKELGVGNLTDEQVKFLYEFSYKFADLAIDLYFKKMTE